MGKELFFVHGMDKGDEELLVALRLDGFVPHDFVISAGAHMCFLADGLDAGIRYMT